MLPVHRLDEARGKSLRIVRIGVNGGQRACAAKILSR